MTDKKAAKTHLDKMIPSDVILYVESMGFSISGYHKVRVFAVSHGKIVNLTPVVADVLGLSLKTEESGILSLHDDGRNMSQVVAESLTKAMRDYGVRYTGKWLDET